MFPIWLNKAMSTLYVREITDSQTLGITCTHMYERKTACGRLDCYPGRVTPSPSRPWEDDASVHHLR